MKNEREIIEILFREKFRKNSMATYIATAQLRSHKWSGSVPYLPSLRSHLTATNTVKDET